MDGPVIQVPYYNAFGSVWEYHRAFLSGEIDWHSVLAEGCPLCGSHDCWRGLTPYKRWAIDLLPFREEQVAIARFFCRNANATFSMLPVQLVPYHRYTANSIIFCLLLAAIARDEGLSLFAVAEKRIELESKISGYLLSSWLDMTVKNMRRALPVLGLRTRKNEIMPAAGDTDHLSELFSICRALGIRGPPDIPGIENLERIVQVYARDTGHFLLGIPSQDRICRVVS